MNKIDELIEDRDFCRALLESCLDRVNAYREIGIHAGERLTAEQVRFLDADRNSLVVYLDELFRCAESELAYRHDTCALAAQARIDGLYDDDRFGT